jgi:SPW repeat-containing protein
MLDGDFDVAVAAMGGDGDCLGVAEKVAILAAIRLGHPAKTEALSWINCLMGVWAFVSPWIYGYEGEQGRLFNSFCIGVIVFIAAMWSASGTAHTERRIIPHG